MFFTKLFKIIMIKTHDIPVKQERVEVLYNGGFGVQ